jgi:hypothetical protein
MAGGTCCLFLCAILLLLPAIASSQCVPQLTIQRLFTQDILDTEKNAFAPEENFLVVLELNNAYGRDMPRTQWTTIWSYNNSTTNGTLDHIPSGISPWTWEVMAPPTEGSYTFTIRVYDLFCNSWVEGGISFSVDSGSVPTTPWAEVMLERVFTKKGEGESGVEQTTFAPGDAIQYAYTVNVPGSDSVTTNFDFLVTGPRGLFSWNGYIGNVPGRWTHHFDERVPPDALPGTYTFQATMSINGQSMTKESSFTVSAALGQPLPICMGFC